MCRVGHQKGVESLSVLTLKEFTVRAYKNDL